MMCSCFAECLTFLLLDLALTLAEGTCGFGVDPRKLLHGNGSTEVRKEETENNYGNNEETRKL